MSVTRRSFEAGHRPKFLVVIDETSECDRAVHFAARRCLRTGASLIMLGVVEPPEESLEFLGVGDAMRAEAEGEIADNLDRAAERVRGKVGIEPEIVLRSGEMGEAIRALIDQDRDISFLGVAAAVGKEGPGPLVQQVAGKGAGQFPVPVVIVPGDLSDGEIDALAG